MKSVKITKKIREEIKVLLQEHGKDVPYVDAWANEIANHMIEKNQLSFEICWNDAKNGRTLDFDL